MPPPKTIDKLSSEDRAFIDNELRKNGFGGLEQLVDILAKRGVQISKTALGNYNVELKKRTEAMRQSAEMATQIINSIGDINDIGLVAAALSQQLILDFLVEYQKINLDELDESQKTAVLLKIFKVIPELSRGFVVQDKHKAAMELLIKNTESGKTTKEEFLQKAKELYGVG